MSESFKKKLPLIVARCLLAILVWGLLMWDTVSRMKPMVASAASDTLTISYDYKTGNLSAYFNNASSYSSVKYSWSGGLSGTASSSKTSSTTSGASFAPTEAGTYICTATLTTSVTKDGKTSTSTKTLQSAPLSLYKVTADPGAISLNSINGIYKAGDRVRAKAVLSTGEEVRGWSASVPGVKLPSYGNRVYFDMPSQSLTLTLSKPKVYSVKVSGGTADKYQATEGETITVKASSVTGKAFKQWYLSGASVLDPEASVTKFTMPANDVTCDVVYADGTASSREAAKAVSGASAGLTGTSSGSAVKTSTVAFTDPTRVKYSVTRTNNYKVRLYHAKLGPNYDAAFKKAVGSDTLVTDYFTLVINGNKNISQTPGPVTVVLTLPEDIQKTGRNFRMICVTKDGYSYSFADEDEDDTTVTFSCDRFTAYAIAFNDIDYAALEAAAEQKAQEEAAAQAQAQAQAQVQADTDAAYNKGYSQGKADAEAEYASSQSSSPSSSDSASSSAITPNPPIGTDAVQGSEIHPASESQTSGSSSPSPEGATGSEPQHLSSGTAPSITTSTTPPQTVSL